MRAIDADALLERAIPIGWSTPLWVSDIAIKDAPTLDVIERKKGKWLPVDSFSAFGGDESMWMAHGNPVAFYYCSNCKEHAYAGEDGYSLITNFCPNCGADMRGDKQDG